MLWSYGLTTVPARAGNLLDRTIKSLDAAGFPLPRLFVDGAESGFSAYRLAGHEVTYRFPIVRAGASWHLALMELYLREPHADRYAIFQDDAAFVKGLKDYVSLPFPAPNVYLNLYTGEGNRSLSLQHGGSGWFKSNQCGKGAVGLVFDNAGCRALLAGQHMVDRARDRQWGWRKLDGGIVEAMRKAGGRADRQGRDGWDWNPTPFEEWCHRPSLCQHLGVESVMDKRKDAMAHEPGHPTYRWPADANADDFPGEVDIWPLVGLSRSENGGSVVEEADGNPATMPTEAPGFAFAGVLGAGGTPERMAWEAERQAILDAIEGDRRRAEEQPSRRTHFMRWIGVYAERLAEHERRKPT